MGEGVHLAMYKMPKIMSQLDTFNNFIDHF